MSNLEKTFNAEFQQRADVIYQHPLLRALEETTGNNEELYRYLLLFLQNADLAYDYNNDYESSLTGHFSAVAMKNGYTGAGIGAGLSVGREDGLVDEVGEDGEELEFDEALSHHYLRSKFRDQIFAECPRTVCPPQTEEARQYLAYIEQMHKQLDDPKRLLKVTGLILMIKNGTSAELRRVCDAVEKRLPDFIDNSYLTSLRDDSYNDYKEILGGLVPDLQRKNNKKGNPANLVLQGADELLQHFLARVESYRA